MKYFNQQMAASLGRLKKLEDQLQEAEIWRAKYFALTERLGGLQVDNALAKKADRLIKSGQLDEAGKVLDQLLNQQEDDVGRAAGSHFSRGQLFELQFEPLNALEQYEKAYQYRGQNLTYATTYADLLLKENMFQRASQIYDQILAMLRKLEEDDSVGHEQELANTLTNMGVLYRETQRLEDAEAALNEALEIQRKLAKLNPHAYEADLAQTLNSLGLLYRRTQRLPDAEKTLNEALGIYRRLAKVKPAVFEGDEARTLTDLGSLYGYSQRFAEAESTYGEAIQIWRRRAKGNPAAHEPDLAQTLNNIGIIYRDANRLTEAQKAFSEAVEIRRRLAAANPSAYEPRLSTHTKQSGLFLQTWSGPSKSDPAIRGSSRNRPPSGPYGFRRV